MTLLLGKDFLKNSAGWKMHYQNQNPMITLGDVPLNNIHVNVEKMNM